MKRFREGSWQGGSHTVIYRVPSDVYEPFDDTFLFLSTLEKELPSSGRFVEVGCGSGVLSVLAALMGHEVVSCDVTEEAVAATRENAALNDVDFPVRRSDMAQGIAVEGAIVAMNPPYLPTAEGDKVKGPLNVALDGGPEGIDVSLRFLREVLPRGPKEAYLLVSDLAPLDRLKEAAAEIGWAVEEIAEKKVFMERLLVWRLRPTGPRL